MNLFEKSLLIALTFFFSIECSQGKPRKLKPKLSRQQQNKVKKEVAQIFKTDDKKEIAKEVQDVNALAVTPQEKQQVNVALQQEVIKETAEIKADLIQVQEDTPQYITYDQALEIIKSKKDIANMRRSSWTNSLIVKPFTKTYRLYLRLSNQKEYTALLETERKALEHALNVQAHNNLTLLYAALDLEINGYKEKTEHIIAHMFKKDNFYSVATHAFEGGALLASNIELSKELKELLARLSMLITNNFNKISNNPAIVQSIWEMNEILWNTQHPREGYRIKQGLKPEKDVDYDWFIIQKLCTEAAKANNQVLHIKKSYSQYLKDWISQPKNLAKAGLVMAAIGGLYLYGPAIPTWLKEYANSSIGSMKATLARGYNATISSVKNLWNKVRGNQTQELPDSKESRMEAQEQESETEDYLARKGRLAAQEVAIDAQVSQRMQDFEDKLARERDERNREDRAQYALRNAQKDAFDADQMSQRIKDSEHELAWEAHEYSLERDKKIEAQMQARREERKRLEEQQRRERENQRRLEREAEEYELQLARKLDEEARLRREELQLDQEAAQEEQILEREKIVEQARQEQQQEFDYPAQEEQADVEAIENARFARERMPEEARPEEQSIMQPETSEVDAEPEIIEAPRSRVSLNPTSGQMNADNQELSSTQFEDLQKQEDLYDQKWQESIEAKQQEEQAFKELQRAGQGLNDFDAEIQSEADHLADRIKEEQTNLKRFDAQIKINNEELKKDQAKLDEILKEKTEDFGASRNLYETLIESSEKNIKFWQDKKKETEEVLNSLLEASR